MTGAGYWIGEWWTMHRCRRRRTAHSKRVGVPRDAARRALEELSGPCHQDYRTVLSAVSCDMCYPLESLARLYQQFAWTIAISVVLSAFKRPSHSAGEGRAMTLAKEGKPGAVRGL